MIAERRFAEPIAARRTSPPPSPRSPRPWPDAGDAWARRPPARTVASSASMAPSPASPSAPAGRCATPKRVARPLPREVRRASATRLDAGFGFDMARLAVLDAAPLDPAQIDLAGDAAAEADLDGLIDRIGARLGAAARQPHRGARQPHPRTRRGAGRVFPPPSGRAGRRSDRLEAGDGGPGRGVADPS